MPRADYNTPRSAGEGTVRISVNWLEPSARIQARGPGPPIESGPIACARILLKRWTAGFSGCIIADHRSGDACFGGSPDENLLRRRIAIFSRFATSPTRALFLNKSTLAMKLYLGAILLRFIGNGDYLLIDYIGEI